MLPRLWKGILAALILCFFSATGHAQEQQDPGTEAAPVSSVLNAGEAQQPAQPPAGSEAQAPPLTDLNDIRSLWQLTELGGGIRWGIFFVFGLALLFILKKLIELSLDTLYSKKLESLDYDTVTLLDVRTTIKESNAGLLAALLDKQFDIFDNTGKPEVLHEEQNSFIAIQQEQFSRFKNRMSFLADTAGALGLLGTVWGMFLTFFGGNLDNQRILHGMGVALITTLLGLVVSIVINFASTEVSNFFNRRVEKIFRIADTIRMRFFINRVAPMYNGSGGVAEAPPATAGSVPRSELRLRNVSEPVQQGSVGRHLSGPLTVQTITANGLPVTGVEVVFEVVGEGGYFVDKQTSYSLSSNKKGLAEASFLLTGEVGKRSVVASIRSNPKIKTEFQINGVPGPPAKLVPGDGNHQTTSVGQLLGKPFVVALSDAFGNPVADNIIIFTVTRGGGRFANYNPDVEVKSNGLTGIFKRKFMSQKVTYETRTDKAGLAEASIVLGSFPGVNEVTAVAKGLSKSPVVFQAMAQPAEEVAT